MPPLRQVILRRLSQPCEIVFSPPEQLIRRGWWQRTLFALLVLVCCMQCTAAQAQLKPVKRVLVFYELGLSSPAVSVVDQKIRDALEQSPYQIELYREYLETTLFPDESSQREIREWFVRKYRDRRPDLIIAAGVSPLRFMADAHERFFRGIPVVFCSSFEQQAVSASLGSDFTGVWEDFDPSKTLDAALQLQPATKHVAVVGGVTPFDRLLESHVRDNVRKYQGKLDFTYLTDLDMSTLLERVQHLPEHTIILYTHIGQDAAGTRFISATQAGPMLVQVANSPMFSTSDADIGYGGLGGYVHSFAEEGQLAGRIAVRILQGARPQDIPIVTGSSDYIFDWRALKRWGLKASALPPGSIVLYRQPSLWQAYAKYVVGAIVLLSAQTLLILGLLWQWAKKRRAEADLAVIHERLRLAVQAGKSVGWDLDVNSGKVVWFGDLQNMFGIPSDAFHAQTGDFYRYVHPEDRQYTSEAVAWARENRQLYAEEFRIVRPDGTLRWVGARGEFSYAADGKPLRMLGMAVDITERRRAEEAGRESELRFHLVADTAPVMIWMSDTDNSRNYFNKGWLDFSGKSIESQLGQGWAEGVHPESLSRCLATYNQAFDQRRGFRMEYRLRRYDGEYRWILETGVPRFNTDGSFAGYIGSSIDVTDRKAAEEALANLSGRLLEAQEEERQRLAREIHDDYNQRLAVLAIDLEKTAQSVADSPQATKERIDELKRRVAELGADLHTLSHRLHSSTLESLGLVAGVGAFCEEFVQQQGIKVDFAHENIPQSIPDDAALCLFRVVQEGLWNVRKHSGAKQAKVRLERSGEKLHLTVSDEGAGFDPSTLQQQSGIGLLSMEERLRLLGGQFQIRSRPKQGARIDAWLPLKAAAHPTSLGER